MYFFAGTSFLVYVFGLPKFADLLSLKCEYLSPML